MKKTLVLVSTFAILWASSASAHPGNTAADGAHYCRTNCDYWGVPYGVRHSHSYVPLAPLPTLAPPVGQVMGATTTSSDQIFNKDVPAVVSSIFKQVFGRDINPKESTYWKNRARTDKKTKSALKGAMLFQKAKGLTMPKS